MHVATGPYWHILFTKNKVGIRSAGTGPVIYLHVPLDYGQIDNIFLLILSAHVLADQC